MKKSKQMIVGIACGLISAGALFLYMQGVQGEADTARAEALARYGGEQIEVCVAERDIQSGEKIDVTNTVTKLWVADLLPQDAVRNFTDVSGKQATSPILAGEVISLKRFQEDASRIDVPSGFSALSVPAKDVQTVGGAVATGSRIDVYATGASDTSLIARDVLVLATSSGSSETKASPSLTWITLAVKADSVQEIIAASLKTELYFVMPGSQEKEVHDESTDSALR